MQEETPLPHGVREKHGSWHYVRNDKWTKLCRIADGRARLYERLWEVAGGTPGSGWHAILSYINFGMKELAIPTQKKYRQYALSMLHHFGHWQLREVEPMHCAKFLKWCRENERATTGNREKSFMSSVWEYALGEGWAMHNPWRGIRRNKERPSRVYVEHETLTATIDRAPPELQSLFAVAYLTGMRETDLRLLKRENIAGNQLEWTESKTGKHNSQTITPTLRTFLNAALARSSGEHVFVSATGLPWSEWGLQSALRRFKPGFQFRQLRAKAQTDRPDANILGHTGQLLERYTRRRKLAVVK